MSTKDYIKLCHWNLQTTFKCAMDPLAAKNRCLTTIWKCQNPKIMKNHKIYFEINFCQTKQYIKRCHWNIFTTLNKGMDLGLIDTADQGCETLFLFGFPKFANGFLNRRLHKITRCLRIRNAQINYPNFQHFQNFEILWNKCTQIVYPPKCKRGTPGQDTTIEMFLGDIPEAPDALFWSEPDWSTKRACARWTVQPLSPRWGLVETDTSQTRWRTRTKPNGTPERTRK